MTPQLAAAAFELFTQAERSSDRVNGGLGIGLALVRGLVELHGGSVAARSDGLGRGSELVVLLPRADPAPADAAASVPPPVRGLFRCLSAIQGVQMRAARFRRQRDDAVITAGNAASGG